MENENGRQIRMEKAKVIESVKKLKENEKRKFDQSIDLIINLKSFDIKRDSVNLFLQLPYKLDRKSVV
jgi:ribosomal protein L1